MTIIQKYQEVRDEPNDNITESDSFKSKIKIAGTNFWRTHEMPLIKWEINLILTWSQNCAVSSAIGETTFAIADTKLYVPVVTLSIQDNLNLLEQLRFWFKTTISWNKYWSRFSTKRQNRYLDFLINPGFQGVIYFLKMRTIEKYTQDLIFQK